MALKNNFVKVFNYPSMFGLPHPFTYVMVICVMSSLLNCTNFNCVSPIGVLYMAYLLRLTIYFCSMSGDETVDVYDRLYDDVSK